MLYTNLSNLSLPLGVMAPGVVGLWCRSGTCHWSSLQMFSHLCEDLQTFTGAAKKMTNFFWKLPRKKENSYSRIKNHTLPHNKRKMWVDIIFRYLQVEEFLMAIFGWKTILSQSGIISVLIQVLYSWKNEELESGSPKTHRLQIGEDGFNWLQLFICRGIWAVPVNSRKGVIAATSLEQRCDA